MIVYVATFEPAHEAYRVLGVYSTEALAERKIQGEIACDKEYHKMYPQRYEQRRNYYNIHEHQLDDVDVELNFSYVENNYA